MSKLVFPSTEGGEPRVETISAKGLTLGRDDDNDVCLEDGTVSRHHARLSLREDGVCVLEDLRSANGSELNRMPIQQAELQDGDHLQFGKVAAIYYVSEADAAALPAIEPAVGTVFAGRYRLDSSLGETPEYQNFLAEDIFQGGRTSLKIFYPDLIERMGGFERAAREFARIRAAPAHARLVRLRDFGRWRGTIYLAAEWIDGHALLDPLRRRGALSGPETIRLARQVAEATDHARAHGLPAPDLDPRAILVAFDTPVDLPAWQRLLDEPLERWPLFTLKVSPRLLTEKGQTIHPLGALICELMGHPPQMHTMSPEVKIPSLGEQGNEALAHGLDAAGHAFENDAKFIEALAHALGS
jgi:hypothetical protein